MKRKQNQRRAIATLFMLVLVVSIVSPLALASSSAPQPRYIAVSNITSAFDIFTLGVSCSAGTVTLRSGYTAELRVSIMQSPDASSWSNYQSWTTFGSSYLSLTEYYAVERGYFYLAHAEVTVYNSNGNVVECVSLDSPYKYY